MPQRSDTAPSASKVSQGARRRPAAKARHVSVGTWVFGALLLVFFVWVFAFGPNTLPEFRLRILAILSAMLAGLFGYFLTGDVGVKFDATRKGEKAQVKWGIKATGGFALFVIVLYWWFSPFAPIGVMKALSDIKADTKNIVLLLEKELKIHADQALLLKQASGASVAPTPSQKARDLAKLIPLDADPYARALKAIADGKLDEARQFLDEARQHKDVELSRTYLTESTLAVYSGNYNEAVGWCKKALALRPEEPPVMVQCAVAMEIAGNYGEAEPLLTQALSLEERTLDPNSIEIAECLNDLGALYFAMGKFDEAEPLFKRSLGIREKMLGTEDLAVANSVNNLASQKVAQGKLSEAEPLFRIAIAIRERALGPNHPDVARSVNNLAVAYRNDRKLSEAEPLFKRALTIRENALGSDHPEVAMSLFTLASFYFDQGNLVQAEPLFKRAILISDRKLGANSRQSADLRRSYAQLLRKLQRNEEAKALEAQVDGI